MSCGMVRKVDELGRVVIPKEMRRVLNIRTGSSIEMNINDNNEVVLRKFSEINNVVFYAENFLDVIYDIIKMPCAICDEDKIILTKGIGKIEQNKKIKIEVNDIHNYFFVSDSPFEDKSKFSEKYGIFPIQSEGVICGYLILFCEENCECDFEKICVLVKFLNSLLRF